MSRPGFLEQCEAWRKRGCDANFMTDVYDGKIWKDWQKVSGVPYLKVPGNLLLMLNVDWFRPLSIHLTVLGLFNSKSPKNSKIQT